MKPSPLSQLSSLSIALVIFIAAHAHGSEPSGLSICTSKKTSFQPLSYLKEILPKPNRSFVSLGRKEINGPSNRSCYPVFVDSELPIQTLNSETLLSLVRTHGLHTRIFISRPNETFDSQIFKKIGGVLRPIKFETIFHVLNYVSRASAAPGQTLPPPTIQIDDVTVYSVHENIEIYVATDQPQSEIEKTIAHELIHARILKVTQDPGQSRHGYKNVDQLTQKAENEVGL